MLATILIAFAFVSNVYAVTRLQRYQVFAANQSATCDVTLGGKSFAKSVQFSYAAEGTTATFVASSATFNVALNGFLTGSVAFTQQLINAKISSLGGQINSSTLLLPGSTIGSVDIAKSSPGVVPTQQITAGNVIKLSIPLLSIGAVSPASGSAQVLIGAGHFTLNLNANISGSNSNFVIDCNPQANPVNYLASVKVGGTLPTANSTVSFSPVDVGLASGGSRVGIVFFNYNCTLSGVSAPVVITPFFTSPSGPFRVPRNTDFSLGGPFSVIYIYDDGLAALNSTVKSSNFNKISYTFNQMKATGSGLSPASINLLSKSVTSSRINFTTPLKSGYIGSFLTGSFFTALPPFNFTTGSNTGTTILSYDQANVTFNLYDASDNLIKALTGNCVVDVAAPLSVVTIV